MHDHLTRLRRLAVGALMLLGFSAHAATYTLPGGSLPAGCSTAGSVVSCGSLSLGQNDVIVVTEPTTLNTVNFSIGNNAEINANGSPGDLTINASGSLSVQNNAEINANLNAQGSISIGNNGVIAGNITAGGSLAIGNNSIVYGVCTPHHARCLAPPQPVNLHHFEFEHPASGLTCAPSEIILKACENADCSVLYTGNVMVNLTPAGGDSRWSGPNVVTNQVEFSGGSVSLQLRHFQAGQVILGANGTPVPSSNLVCRSGGAATNCRMTFAESGFVFDVPPQIANKPSAQVSIHAVKTVPGDPQTCAPAITGARSLRFWSSYADPTDPSPALAVAINGTNVSGSSPGTALTLSFNANAEATITVRYPDAGLIRLYAEYVGTGVDAGLVLAGSDIFSVRPVGLCVHPTATEAVCAAADASCPGFARAGESFELRVTAVAWESDADSDLCSGNALTPNYRQSGIALGAELVAPGSGHAGSTGVTAVNLAAADGGASNLQQSVSEVGVFRFTATPPAGAYFGETVDGARSQPIGRFFPARLGVSVNTPVLENACNASFTYLGSPFGYLLAPQLTISGLNTAGGVTLNYAGPFWRLPSGLSGRSHANAATTAASLAEDAAGTVSWSGTDVYDGSAQATLADVQLRYVKPLSPEAPFAASVDLYIPAAALTDSDGACRDANGDGLCDALRIDAIGGTELRWGRLAVDNAHQHLEALPVNVSLRAEYYDGNRFVTNLGDSCSTLGVAAHLRLDNNQQSARFDGSISVGSGSTTVSAFGVFAAGVLQLQFSAPGAGNGGFVDLTPQLSAAGMNWLGTPDNPSGRATWGLYRGNPSIIRMREIWH